MLFKKKASDPDQGFQTAAASVFGADVTALTRQRFDTESTFPIVSSFAPWAECDFIVQGEYRGLGFGLYFPVKAFNTERDRNTSHWAFWGYFISLQGDRFRIPATYAFTGRPFRPPDKNVWLQSGKHKGLSVWSEERPFSQAGRSTAEDLMDWTDSEFAALWSAQYALLIRDGIVSIAFWKPDLYDYDSQLKLFSEAVRRL